MKMKEIKQIHAHAVRNNLNLTHILVDKILRANNLNYAESLLLSTSNAPPQSTFLYNKLLQRASRSFSSHQCLHLYSHMRRHACPPNTHSFTYLFSCCASLRFPRNGCALHAQFLKFGFADAYVSTSLIAMYCRNSLLDSARKVFDEMGKDDVACWNSMIGGYARRGRVDEARELFDEMPVRNVISWTAVISGYSQNGRYQEAMEVFMRMWGSECCGGGGGVRPNEVTLVSVLPACANLGALDMGERIEAYARENGYEKNMFVSNALLEMYAKCGNISSARRMFEEIGNKRNMYSWNSMIVGTAVHGKWKEALHLFSDLREGGFKPDDITFVGVLLACTHGGLVDQGMEFFETMENKYGIKPKLEHYGCVVDLLGRAGLLRKAYRIIMGMPMKSDAVIWGTLLGACSFHREEVELAEIAAEYLFKMEPWNPGNYVILSNIYASVGRWDGVAKVWKMKRGRQFKKAAGYSSFEIDGRLQSFVVEDKSHERSDEIYALLDELQERMKLVECDFELHIQQGYYCL